MRVNPGGPIISQQFYRESADETLGPWIDVRGCTTVTYYVTGNGVTSSGVISFEECAPEDMRVNPPTPFGASTGKYSVITTQNASTVDGGIQVAVHISSANFFYVRARISTAIGGGGTVSVGIVAT
jgi:hypothetical protein